MAYLSLPKTTRFGHGPVSATATANPTSLHKSASPTTPAENSVYFQ
jgi:hypothetical protein